MSHAPLALMRVRAPEGEEDIVRRRALVARHIQEFDPDQILIFGVDHFAAFHYAVMPPYCVALGEVEAVNDLGGFAGRLDVARDQGVALVESLRGEGFDPAVSYKMRVDHAFSQPIHLLTGALDRYPVIPVFVSVFTPPLMRFARSRQLGEAVGRFLAASGRRTLVIGSGGLSHHPAHYFPPMDAAPPEILAWQTEGANPLMSEEAWFRRFADMHIAGAESAASGLRGPKEMRLNPEADARAIAALRDGDIARFDDWAPDRVIAEQGMGMLEFHSWIAAAAAFHTAEPDAPLTAVYHQTVEYGVGYGLLYSD